MGTRVSNPAWEIAFGKRLQQARLNAGLTQAQAAKATGVAVNTWFSWEQGTRTPKLWNVPKIAAALGVPIASLLLENDRATCVAEVWLSAETIRDVRQGGRAVALDAAERLARQLEPLIWQAATGGLPRKQDTPARSRPRRSRAEVLAGVRSATEARTRARLAHLESELREIAAERIEEA